MQETIVYPPRTIMEVFKMLPEGTLAEVIDKTLYMSPTPVTNHQRIISKLIIQIGGFLEKLNSGEIFTAPFDVFLDADSNAVQPDLLVVLNANKHIIDETSTIHGVPDLIIEVLSPGNKKHDLITKKVLYEKFGVKEYWVVDPAEKQAIGFELRNNKYEEFFNCKGELKSNLLGGSFYF
ncbi:MAG: Uma2 family endonuclease [Cyclobacteriaceae bacterium]|nr:Uma2 family endonuclease [Cyclobacteriaceae bacterium]